MLKTPKITVAVPTYNRLDLLKRTIESVLNQTEKPDEILIIDDRSTEKEVISFLKSFKGVRFIRNEKNLGNIENISKCFKEAKGDYVIVVQSDDLLLPDCVETFRKKMAEYGNKPAVYFSGGYIIDVEDKVKGKVRPLRGDRYLSPPSSLKELWNSYWFHILIGGWSAYRKDIFKETGYFGRNYGRVGENEMTMKIVPKFPICYVDRPLFAFRVHAMQGLEGQAKNTGHERGIDEAIDGSRVLLDFEKKPEVRKSFSIDERKKRLFLKKPLAFFLLIPIYFLLVGNKDRAKKFFAVFRDFYPKPYISLFDLKLYSGWVLKLLIDYVENQLIRFILRNKRVSDIS